MAKKKLSFDTSFNFGANTRAKKPKGGGAKKSRPKGGAGGS